MDYGALFQRILKTVDTEAYFTPVDHIRPGVREALSQVRAMMTGEFDVDGVRQKIRQLAQDGQIDRVAELSALHVVACHPRVADYPEAARLVGEQELAALDKGGPDLEANLASVERHRGVLAFLRGHSEVALEYFTRALERQRSPENMTNVLCALLRLGEEREAKELIGRVRTSFPSAFVERVEHSVRTDPDLALLRG